ncbi:MAG: carboxy terminal-processing peptidase [Kiritimatiellia bacterium]
MKTRRRLLPSILIAALATLVFASTRATAPSTPKTSDQQPKPEYRAIAQMLAKKLPRNHLRQKPFDTEVAYGAWTNAITAYDPDHTYFTRRELDELAPRAPLLCKEFASGNVSFGFELHQRFLKNLRLRLDFAKQQLKQGFDCSKPETFVWDRKDAPWPENDAQRRELWRLTLKNAYLAHLLAKELDATNSTQKAQAPAATNTIPILTPEQHVLKRYSQLLTVFEDMDSETIFQRYASAFCSVYDPHTDYLSPMREEDFEMDMNLKLVGIGATLRSEDGVARIENIVPGGPASRDTRDIRLVPGDKIIAVAQDNEPPVDIIHMALDRAVRKIRGKKGTRVVLTVIPASDPSGSTTKTVDLIRDEVNLEDAAVTGRVCTVSLPGGAVRKLGYIKVPSFYGTGNRFKPGEPDFRSCSYDTRKWMAKLNAENVQGMVLDLRNNGGGLLPEAIMMTSLFIAQGPAVQVRDCARSVALAMPEYSVACRTPLVVLINRFSASASEIVAGALQDYGRAVIVGDTQSHGKGTVQTILDLGGEQYGSLKVTTASFYRVNGASTQVRGVHSDIVVPSFADGLKDIGEDSLPRALAWTCIAPADYTPVSNLSLQIPGLKKKAAERLAKDGRYQSYVRLLNRLEVFNNTRSVSLERKARLEQMRTERAARKELDLSLGGEEDGDNAASGDGKKGEKPDIVLDAALDILSDLVEQIGPQVPVNTEPDLRSRLFRIFTP